MNRRTSILMAIFIVAVAGAAMALGLSAGQPTANGCKAGTDSRTYQVVIKADKVSPGTTQARMCDRLTITNEDPVTRLIAFGPHEHHVPYDGVTERLLTQNQSLTITLNQTGAFLFHDHLHDEVQGGFVVSK